MSIISGVGASGTTNAASGGLIIAHNDINTIPFQVAATNPDRKQITFHNPGTVNIYVAQTTVITVGGGDAAFAPTPAALGGCFLVFANGGSITIDGECQKAWQAFSASGGGNPLTVMQSRV